MSHSAPLSSPRAPRRRNSPSPETVALARKLVEGTVLSRGAIREATGLSLRRLRGLIAREGWRRPAEAACGRRGKPPELLARMRALWEGTRLTQVAIGRELRVHPNHVSHCIRRGRWVRPAPEGAPGAPVAIRWPKRPGRPLRMDAVARARELYTETTLSLKAISARTGVSFPSVWRLGRRYGWVRPEGAPSCTRHLSLGRAGLSRRLNEGRRRVRALAEGWAASWADAPEPSAAKALARARRLAGRASGGAPAR